MERAYELALKGQGRVSPNPAVGALIVKNNKIIGEGYHKKFGSNHAEVEALRNCKVSPEDSTLYITLEPCNHHGLTAPCVTQIVKSKISRVVIGQRDYSVKENLKGAVALRQAKIKVEFVTGEMKEQCHYLVADFHKFQKERKPWVILKFAQSIDGKVRSNSGDSEWITSPKLRRIGHNYRRSVDAILVGSNTVKIDDPLLTARFGPKHDNLIRLIVDSKLAISSKSQISLTAKKYKTIIFTVEAPLSRKAKRLKDKGIEIVQARGSDGKVNLHKLLDELGSRGVMRLLVEGGPKISTSFFDAKLMDQLLFFISPKVIGGRHSSIAGRGVDSMDEVINMSSKSIEVVDDEIVVNGFI